MKELTMNEIQQISGALYPSLWAVGAIAGTCMAVGAVTVTAFTVNPIPLYVGLQIGPALGAGLFAAVDILKEFDTKYTYHY